MKKLPLTIAVLCLATIIPAAAQTLSVSTNVLDCSMGTVNAEVSWAFDRHFTFNASGRYNPWENTAQEDAHFNKCRGAAAGVRYWAWNAHSGWWLGLKARYEEYSRHTTRMTWAEEGDAFGGGFSAGYAWMLGKHFNLDLGAGLWGGGRSFTKYSCPHCGRVIERGTDAFIEPHEIQASIVYIF